MSYKQVVLRDNPIAFWPLNGTSSLRTYATILLEYKTYQDWLDAEPNYGADPITFTLQDISQGGNHAAYTLGSPNFLDILPLATLSNYDTQLAGCKINSTSEIGIQNQYSPTGTGSTPLYNMFYTGTENLTFGVEMWLAFDSNPPTDNVVFQVQSGGSSPEVIAKAYINNDKIYFTVNGKDKVAGTNLSYTTYKQVSSWDSQIHIFFYYSKGSINIGVNSLFGQATQVSQNFIWHNSYSSSPEYFYKIGPSGSNNKFTINDLSFYDYVLSDNQIKSHMVWGTYDSSPQNYVKQSSGFFFDIKDDPNMLAYQKDFTNPANYRSGVINNLIVDKTGMTLQTIPSLTKSGSGTLTASNGLSVTSTAGAMFSNLSKYYSLGGISVLGQINWTLNGGSSPATILAIDGINNNESLYLAQSTDNKLTLYYHSVANYYPYASTDTIIAQVPTAVASNGNYNFGLSINNNIATIYLSGSSSVSGNLPSYTYSNLNLYFGNQYSSATTIPLSGSISNVSILNSYINPSTYSLYGSNDMLTIPFISSLAVSQIGTWTYGVLSSQLNKIFGSRVTWETGTSDNSVVSLNESVVFQYSMDNGTTWNQITNGYPVTKFADNSQVAYPDITFRAILSVQDSSSLQLPRVDKVLINFYKNLEIFSDAGAFVLAPRQGSYIGDTYSIKNNFFNILSRTSNFGIKVAQIQNSNSVATINTVNGTATYQTIEFWFRYDSVSSSIAQTILDTVGLSAKLYIDPATNIVYSNGFSNVFINGVSLAAGRVLSQGEAYHFVCVYPNQTNAQIYLGGDQRLQTFSYGTFGYISLYPSAFAQGDAQTRYLEFLSSNVAQVTVSSNTDSIGTIGEYSSTVTGYNGGQPVLAYPHPISITV